ncbi:MAG: hypothetical protein J3Q66DRAFT_171494 [Benniella sp.]|nr:MAG: hypothetical protein J3Q66DRAFT_171494 [Benniella sp.]
MDTAAKSSQPDAATTVLEGQLVDLSLDSHDGNHPSDSGSGDDNASDNGDNISLGSMESDHGPNSLPPTYDLSAILESHAAATANLTETDTNGPATTPHNDSNATLAVHPPSGAANRVAGRVPSTIPTTAEMENLPNDVVALILETLTILELFDLYVLSDRWRQLTTRALLDKFTMSHVVLWIDQEGHRTFRPIFVFDSFDEATNRIRWLPKPTAKPEHQGQVYSKTFGISKPVVRIISVGDVDQYDYLNKEAQMPILKPGTRTILGSEKGCPWAFIYKVSSFTRKGKKVDGERWIEPISFECHLDFLNPRRAHKLRLLWYLQKSSSTLPLVGSKVQKHVNRSKVEGAVPAQQMNEFFSGTR